MLGNSRKLGKCVFCSQRVKTDHAYVTTVEGYAHRNCLNTSGIIA